MDNNPPSTSTLLDLISSSTEVLYEDAPCGYIFTYPDGRFLKVNRTFLSWTDYSQEEILEQKKFQQLLSIGSRIYYETNYGPLLRIQGFLREIMLDLDTKDGRQMPVLINSSEMRDEEGNVLIIKSTLFDMRDRRKYEKELLVAKRKAEQATIRAVFLAKAGEKLRENDDISQHLKEVAELAIEDFCDACAVDLFQDNSWQRAAESHKASGKIIPPFPSTVPELNGPIFIEDVDTHGAPPEFLRKLLYELEPQSLIIVPIKRSGKQVGIISLFYTELGKRFYAEDKELAVELAFGICGAMERIELHKENTRINQELKESHEWLSTTLQSIGDAVMVINPDKTVGYLNSVAELLTGWTNQEAENMPMLQVFNITNQLTGGPAFNPVDAVLRDRKIVELANNTALIRRDGTRIIIEDSASPLMGADGIIRGVVLVFRDVTEKHRKETQKNELLSALKTEKEVREKFVATLSHDLRSPLTSVKLNLQLILKKSADQQISSLADRAVTRLSRMDRMIQDLLDANRLRAGEPIPLPKKEMDFAAVAREVVSDLTLIHGDFFILKSPEKLMGVWNPDGIRRILENLCNNAVKYGTPKAPVNIYITTLGSEVRLMVHNEGRPIPEEDQKTLFDLYKRVENNTTHEQKGWGLGLTLVKGVTESHQGAVSVKSSPEEGTTFEVVLPLISK